MYDQHSHAIARNPTTPSPWVAKQPSFHAFRRLNLRTPYGQCCEAGGIKTVFASRFNRSAQFGT
jgi:hypothetical protein